MNFFNIFSCSWQWEKFEIVGLLKKAHLLCCAANRTAQRIFIYASRFGFLRALHLDIFEQPHCSQSRSQVKGGHENTPWTLDIQWRCFLTKSVVFLSK